MCFEVGVGVLECSVLGFAFLLFVALVDCGLWI